jgi:hypothetical protein
MTITKRCPRCDKYWDICEFPAQTCFGCGYPDDGINTQAMEAVEGYAWWPRVDESRFGVKADAPKRAA